jgi:K+-sensing histidine kinase KdpD
LTLAEHDHTAVLTVADDGPGIPPEHHQRVFERFTRLDQARSTATGGAGLGLAIVLDIVRRHHGTIVIDPQHQPGARFIVTLPTAEAAEPAANSEPPSGRTGRGAEMAAEGKPSPRPGAVYQLVPWRRGPAGSG